MARRERRPVTGEHPCIAAAVAVLKQHGGPMRIGEIFELAEEAGLLPGSSHNTIRGRFSAHQAERSPLIVPAPGRTWALNARSRVATLRSVGRTWGRVIDVTWLRRKRAPAALVKVVEGAPDGKLTARALVLRQLDPAALAWILHSLPLKVELRERLLRARGVQGRTSTLNAEERRERDAARRAARSRRRQAVA